MMFPTPTEHAQNAPSTWLVQKTTRSWVLTTSDGTTLDTFTTRKDAEGARATGWLVKLHADEARWYAGEKVAGWKPYAQ